MDVGMSLFFQNEGWLVEETDAPVGVSDQAVYRRDRALAQLAEPLGFDSIWSVEHHFTGYSMVPDVLQFLAYMAGQTKRIRLGTMVVVLPWNQPVRVAGSLAMLDNLSDGRVILGIGRGLGRVEFEGFGVPMDESRSRFKEAAELILSGLDQGYVEYHGEHYQQAKRWIRPAPVRSFRGRAYASAVSPESMEIMAQLGVGLLIVPQKPWDTIKTEVEAYRQLFEKMNDFAAPEPIVVSQVFCDEDGARAREYGERLIGEYYTATLKHYELLGEHFKKTKGYEYYEKTSEALRNHESSDTLRWYADLQCYGTPEQCVERIGFIKEHIGCSQFIGMFGYSSMESGEPFRNAHLFAEKVLPRLKEFGPKAKQQPDAKLSFPAAF